jgi:hypothetical protein
MSPVRSIIGTFVVLLLPVVNPTRRRADRQSIDMKEE